MQNQGTGFYFYRPFLPQGNSRASKMRLIFQVNRCVSGKCKYLRRPGFGRIDDKGQQVEQAKGHGQVVLTVTEIVFDVIALVFKGIKALIFDLPAGAAGFNQIDHVVFSNLDIGNPAVMTGAFGTDKEAVLEEIDVVGILCAV